MARPRLFLLLTAVAAVLFAELAGFNPAGRSWGGSAVTLAPAELRVGDLSSETRSTLTRGGFAMAAVESSRRKLRAPQRPPAHSLILTSRCMAEGLACSETGLRPWSEPPLKPVKADWPFLARGPPAWTLA